MGDFRIVSSQRINQRFEELCAQAKSARRGLFVLETASEIFQRLSNDPLSAGEPQYRLRNMQLQVRHVVKSPWSVPFAVDEKRKLVYLKNIALLG